MLVGLDAPKHILRVDLLRALHSLRSCVAEERQATGVAGEFITKCHLAETVYADVDGAEKMEFPKVHDAFQKGKTHKATGSRLADVTWPSGRGKEAAEKGTKI